MDKESGLKIVFVGSGAVGGSTAAWVAANHTSTYLLKHGQTGEAARANGITTYQGDSPEMRTTTPVKVIDDLSEAVDADVVMIAVKLYDLPEAARTVREKLGDRPLVVGMQNGVENQSVLTRFFSQAAYCVVGYNAWVDAPGVIGYQKKGPLILGTPDNSMTDRLRALTDVLNSGVETLVTDRLQDAVHCKLVINLSNSVTTLVGMNVRPITDMGLFQKILAGTIYEGVEVIKAAGYRETRLGGLPSWTTLWAAARLPQLLTRGTFHRNLKKMVISSMGQDVLVRKRSETELEYINGYLLALADRNGCHAPYNRAIYRLCKAQFARTDFEPMDVREVWTAINKEIASAA